jgi:hypothetical protein
VFALVAGDAEGHALADALRGAFGDTLARVDVSRVRNRGATCETLP